MHSDTSHIAHIRKDYQKAALDESHAGNDPIVFFSKWFAEAIKAETEEVNAMTLATVAADGQPHARIVLLKGLQDSGFVFFTNYESAKAKDIAAQPKVSLVFFWKELERQVRILGEAHKLSDAENDAYYHTRPYGSQIGAWASPQSRVIADRAVLENSYEQYEKQYSPETIVRPPHWGGYIVQPSVIEFWQGRSSRLHDRLVFERATEEAWKVSRLAP